MAHVEVSQAATGEAMSPRRRSSVVATLEYYLGTLVEIPAAFLVAAEIVILFAGVVARYVLHQPLIWSDELASILFLWLAMFGAAVAFYRSEHMRMTAIVASAKPSMRAYLDVVATCGALAFLLLIVRPAYEYAYEESFITTPALQIPNFWRAAALPVGTCLMALFAFLRLARTGNGRVVLSAVLSVALLIAVFWLAQPWLRPLGNINLIIFFVGVAGFCVFAGVPIAFGFGLAIFGYLALTTRTPLIVLVGRMDEGMSHLILLAVPLFIFLGLLIEMTGMARAMVAFLASLLGHVRGGLHYVLVGAMYLVSGISGSKAADMAAVAPVLFPEMRERGAKPGDLVALLSATGAQTETIPPSLVLITIGSVTGVATATEVSTIGIVYSVLAGLLIYRQFSWRRIYPMLIETAALSGAILLIIGAATGMAWALTQSGFSASLAKFMTGLPGGVPIFLAVTIVAFVILGSVLEGIPAIVLFGPLLFPIARQVGVHDVHYAMVVILAMGIGLFAPPFGVGYYAACAISRINPDEGMKPIVGYMVALLIGTLIVAAVPWISTGFL